jgi:hypothetical protein
MKKWIWQLFSDGEMVSWLRVAGAVIVLTGCFGFGWSIIVAFGEGVIASAGLLSAVLAAKYFQTKRELP